MEIINKLSFFLCSKYAYSVCINLKGSIIFRGRTSLDCAPPMNGFPNIPTSDNCQLCEICTLNILYNSVAMLQHKLQSTLKQFEDP